MQDKFGRNYSLTIQSNDAQGTTITIAPPFTIEFDVTRKHFSSANEASIRIYNLGKNTRSQIRKDRDDPGTLKQVTLSVGYGTTLTTILTGNVTQAWSVREGTNFITTIEAFEGGFAYANGVFNQAFPENTSYKTIIENIIGSLGPFGVNVGSIGDFPGNIPRGNSYSGNSIDLLTELTGGAFFIDNGRANALNFNEALDGEILIINAQTGLLGTPVREFKTFNFEMIMEARLQVGQLVQLQSSTGEGFNMLCKINELHHRGTISESICGDALTSVGCLSGEFIAVKAL